MIRVDGTISTPHPRAACVAAALAPDNLSLIRTRAADGSVTTDLSGTRLRSIIASVDDYLMNLTIAEDICSYVSR